LRSTHIQEPMKPLLVNGNFMDMTLQLAVNMEGIYWAVNHAHLINQKDTRTRLENLYEATK
jgi:hypothetical protein